MKIKKLGEHFSGVTNRGLVREVSQRSRGRETMDKCPRCGEALDFDEVDIGVGAIRGQAGCPACHWTPALKRFISSMQVTPELLRDADHTKADIWSAAHPADMKPGTASVQKLIIPTAQIGGDFILIQVIGWAEPQSDDFIGIDLASGDNWTVA